jgi:cell wall-associated NlpC family hydrolase
MMSADGPEGVLDQYAGFQGASTSLEADYKRFTAADSLAGVFAAQAKRAKAEQARLAAAAKNAKDAAAAAAQAAQAEAAAITAEKNRLIGELARAQNISVQLAQQRQAALEEIARRRAEEQARREALAAARAEARAQAQARAQERARVQAAAEAARQSARRHASRHRVAGVTSRATASAPAPTKRSEPRRHHVRKRAAAPAPTFTPPPPPPPAPAPPSPHGGAQQAIAYAEAQLGEPYQWGASGPSSWDCSGLTMKAWASAGTYLPHYSVAQYEAGVPISVSELRPGDLVFWSTNGAPSGIHHVAMYIGNGQIIHAPRTGRPVEIDNMYYWIPPDLFVRV